MVGNMVPLPSRKATYLFRGSLSTLVPIRVSLPLSFALSFASNGGWGGWDYLRRALHASTTAVACKGCGRGWAFTLLTLIFPFSFTF